MENTDDPMQMGKTEAAVRKWMVSGDRRLKVTDIASYLGLTKQAVYNWFKDGGGPRIEQIRKLEKLRPGLAKLLFED